MVTVTATLFAIGVACTMLNYQVTFGWLCIALALYMQLILGDKR